jgi:hypothetical protein
MVGGNRMVAKMNTLKNKMTNTTQLKKGFRIEFSDIVFEKAYGGRDARDMVWSFIEQALTQQREQLKEKIKGMKTHNDYSTSSICEQCGSEREEITYNQAINDILKEIK